jgi:hypothetical protein
MLRGASGAAAEIWFGLNNASNPLLPITGYAFSTGQVKLSLPSSRSFFSIDTSQLVEKGNGFYAAQLTSTQSAVAGAAYLYSEVFGASQPARVDATITDPSDPARIELPFTILPQSDPVLDSGGLGLDHVFTLGEVSMIFSGGAFFSVPTSQLVQRGFNMYGLVLTQAQRANVNEVGWYVNISSMVPFGASVDMVIASYVASSPAPPYPNPTPPTLPTVPPGNVDEVAAALSRLVFQLHS